MTVEERIKIVWKEVTGEIFVGYINRKDFFDLMSKFAKDYSYNNEISSQFLAYKNDVKCILFDEKLNESKEVPWIQIVDPETYSLEHIITAKRCNRRIWAIFNMLKVNTKMGNSK